MKTLNTELVQIKHTQFCKMYWDTELKGIHLVILGDEDKVFIPISKVFQVSRGLMSATQKYYRKHAKKNKS